MQRWFIQITLIALFTLAVISTGQLVAESQGEGSSPRQQPVSDVPYLSPSPTHKMLVSAGEPDVLDGLLRAGARVVEDYEAFVLVEGPLEAAQLLSVATPEGSAVRDDMNVILLRAGAFDTSAGESEQLKAMGEQDHTTGEQMYLVQMRGPVKREWYDRLASASEVIAAVPNNAFLIRADAPALAAIDAEGFLQWSGEYRPGFKIAPELNVHSEREVSVTVQTLRGRPTESDLTSASWIFGAAIEGEVASTGRFRNLRLRMPASRLFELARRTDVVWIEQWERPELFDEVQGMIVAGKYTGNQLEAPGYVAWLESLGLASSPDFLVDIADSGFDSGILDPEVIHPDFLNVAGLSRVLYARSIVGSEAETEANDITGHGTLNVSITGGRNTQKGFPYTDPAGYSYGLGIHPFVKLGATRIFAPDFTNPNLGLMLDLMYQDGTRVSSNSWGALTNTYTIASQAYDSLVRDAQQLQTGNQEMTIVFASGNKGAGGNVASPGTAKNVITVGASENLRPSGTDGCNIGPEGANDIASLIGFSSGGPVADGRRKPDIVAPGTHIQGAQSQDPSYTGSGVCGPRNFPAGQSFYTWSSGTSHSTPAVAGGAALIRQFFVKTTGKAPSPAMIKAFLLNSSTWMTGFMAGDNLPGVNQGWGMMNVGRALDQEPRILIDQDKLITRTGQTITVEGSVADPGKPFRVTLAWTDAPGAPIGNPVVNNLDLRVEIGGKVYLGNRFSGGESIEGGSADPLNNVEGVWLPQGTSGDFTVKIIGANIAGDGVPGNGEALDQDFALVVYNARSEGDGGGGGGGPVDGSPTVKVTFPVGGETLRVGDLVRLRWEASDDNGIQSQRVELSGNGGATFNLIATLDGNARTFDWRIPSVPTTQGRIKVTALDGVNLPASSMSAANFEIVSGPPDTSPPALTLVAPKGKKTVLGGGLVAPIQWRESDNVGVIQRTIELSTDNGKTFQEIVTLIAPSSGLEQTYEWEVPGALSVKKGLLRITVWDGAGNSASVTSPKNFEVWPLPIINNAEYSTKNNGQGKLELAGRNFRMDGTEIWVDGKKLKKIVLNGRCNEETQVCRDVVSLDNKVHKRVPEGKFVTISVRIKATNQVSPPFQYKRKRANPANVD